MDILSLSKANKALKNIQNLDQTIVAPLAESRFPTVDARLDWLESQASKIKAENSLQVDLSKGTFTDTEFYNGKVQLKMLSSVNNGYSENIMPLMTSNTSGEIVVSESSAYNQAFGWRAFAAAVAGDTNLYNWMANETTGWIQLDFGSIKRRIAKYTIGQHSYLSGSSWATLMPNSWQILASNTGFFSGEEVVLQTITDQTGWGPNVYKTYTFENDSFYRYYRINVTQINGGSRALISRMQVVESNISHTYLSDGNYESPVIDLGEGWQKTKAMDLISFFETKESASVVPALTSNTAPSPYVAFASSAYDQYTEAYKAFDYTDTTLWKSNTVNQSLPQFIGIDLVTPKAVGSYSVCGHTSYMDWAPKTWTFEGSQDKTNWVVLDTVADGGINVNNPESHHFIDNKDPYRYYRVNISAANQVGVIYVMVRDVYMNSIPTGTDLLLEIASSVDGQSFSDYKTLDPASLVQSRYLKLKAHFSSIGTPGEENLYEFDQAAENKVTLNEFTQANGDLKLQTSFVIKDEMPTIEGEGFVYEMPIQKSKFKKIVGIEVK